MSNLNYGSYDSNLNLLNDSTYGYLLQDDAIISDSGSSKAIKDLYINNGSTWYQVKQAYIYDQGSWKVSYRKAYRFYIEINSNSINIDLATYLKSLSIPWDGISPIKGIFKINSGINLGSTDSTKPSLNISTLPGNSSLVILNEGNIYGQGGNGGNGANASGKTPTDPAWVGKNGGSCIVSSSQSSSTKIWYAGGGILWAGGGGGGGGAENGPVVYVEQSGGDTKYCQGGGGGGGGQGYSISSGGSGSNPPRNYGNAGSPGKPGNFSAPGAGGAGGSGNAGTSPERDPGGTGGSGGAWGVKGQQAPDLPDGPDDGSGSAPAGGAGGEAGFILNGPIISIVSLPSPTNGYVNTSSYKGRL